MRAMSQKTKQTDGRTDGNHEAPVDLTAPLQVKMATTHRQLEGNLASLTYAAKTQHKNEVLLPISHHNAKYPQNYMLSFTSFSFSSTK